MDLQMKSRGKMLILEVGVKLICSLTRAAVVCANAGEHSVAAATAYNNFALCLQPLGDIVISCGISFKTPSLFFPP